MPVLISSPGDSQSVRLSWKMLPGTTQSPLTLCPSVCLPVYLVATLSSQKTTVFLVGTCSSVELIRKARQRPAVALGAGVQGFIYHRRTTDFDGLARCSRIAQTLLSPRYPEPYSWRCQALTRTKYTPRNTAHSKHMH